MRRRIISIILAICVIASVSMVSALAVNPSNSVYNKTWGIYYNSLASALSEAFDGDEIYITADYTLESSVTVPSNVTLIIPSSSALNDTTAGNNASGGQVLGNEYVTLTIPENTVLTVNGTLLVAGNQQSTQPQSGCLTGDFGKIDVSGSIDVYGSLYARGEISGTGTVTANSGSSIYQLLQIQDWRGGTAARSAYNNHIFPFNRYEYKNITAKTYYMNGCAMYGQYYIYASSTHNAGDVTIIGQDGILEFENTTATDYIVTEYSSGKMTATIKGAVKSGDMSVTIQVFIFDYTIDSSSTVLPFGYNMDVVVADGASLRITNDIKLLPGCTITVEDGGELIVDSGANLYVYGAGGYSPTYNYGGWSGMPSTAATLTAETGATITNNGVIASSDSTLANIPYSSYSGTTTVKECTQSGSTITVVYVTFYVAQ